MVDHGGRSYFLGRSHTIPAPSDLYLPVEFILLDAPIAVCTKLI